MSSKKKPKTIRKGISKGKKPFNNQFSLQSKTFFLTYKGISNTGVKLNKHLLANFLSTQNPHERIRPEKYLICEQMYDSGQPHFHIILVYSKRKTILNVTFYDYLGIHPNIQPMRNMKAALDYVYKQDPNPLTNMDIAQQKRIARAKDTSSLYQLLQQHMLKDPFNFDVATFLKTYNLYRQVYKANYPKAIRLLRMAHQAQCNRLLFQRPGFKFIDRDLIQQFLSPFELQTFDSWPGYQIIVNHLNQIVQYRFRRPAKTLNLLITGSKSIGKSALVWQQYLQPPFNPLNSHCSVYPMGMKDWFPQYKSEIYDVIYWNQAKLTSYKYDIVLQLLDGSPVLLPAKGGGHKKVDNPLVLMTSNLTINQMIAEKFPYQPQYQAMARQNMSVRITNVVVPDGYDLFLLQRLLVPPSSPKG